MEEKPVIHDYTQRSRLYRARGKAGVTGGCYICGATEHVHPYAFGYQVTRKADAPADPNAAPQDATVTRYADPVERPLCDGCIQFQRDRARAKKRRTYYLYALATLLLGLFMVVSFFLNTYDPALPAGGFSGERLIAVIAPFVVSLAFFLGSRFGLAPKAEPFTEDEGDAALIEIYTGATERQSAGPNAWRFYTRAEAAQYPGAPLCAEHPEG